MKAILISAFLLIAGHIFAQSSTETDLLQLSQKIFRLEVENKIDSLERFFDDKFVVVGSDGASQTKAQYITRLRSGSFVHNDIKVEDNKATIAGNTATVVGKGTFTVTVSGNKVVLPLSYIEVFTRPDANADWKVLAMHASRLQQ